MGVRRANIVVLCACLFVSVALPAQKNTQTGLEDYTRKLRLAPGLVINVLIYGGHRISGELIGDYEDTISITDVSPTGLGFNWSMTYPANASGHRAVPGQEMKQSHKASLYYGSDGVPSGYTDWIRLSDSVYTELKAGKKTSLDFDGNENPASIQKIAEEDLVALVNERKVKLHTLKAKGENGWYLWVLDNPDFPIIMKGDSSWHWIVPSFNYAEASGKNLVTQLQQKGEATTHAIFFAFNSAELKNESKPILNTVAQYLKINPAIKIEVQGHTDNVGGAEFNLKLSQNRAESVKSYLVKEAGISAGRLTTKGLGLTLPVSDNSTPQGRALNRRVVFREVRPAK